VGTLPTFPRPFRAAKGAGMIEQETEKELICIAKEELRLSLSGQQKNRLIQIHKSYLELLPFHAIKLDAIIDDCKRIEDASKKYLGAIRAPGQLSQEEQKKFHIVKAHVEAWVEIYRDLAKECRATYQGLGKRGRPAHWQKEIYIAQMAAWYEDVTHKKPRSGTGSVFPRFLRSCFNQIGSEEEDISDSLLKRVVKRYHDPERARIGKVMEKERRRAIIRLIKVK